VKCGFCESIKAGCGNFVKTTEEVLNFTALNRYFQITLRNAETCDFRHYKVEVELKTSRLDLTSQNFINSSNFTFNYCSENDLNFSWKECSEFF
jgi:hypothetical protein